MAHPNSWMTCPTPGPWHPPEYDTEVDPDPALEDLEFQVKRLEACLAHWGRHRATCPARHAGRFMGIRFCAPQDCTCGLTEARDGTLWDGGDHTDLTAALAWLGVQDGE